METKHENKLKLHALGMYLSFENVDASLFDTLTECNHEDDFLDLLRDNDAEIWEPFDSMPFEFIQEQLSSTYRVLNEVYNLGNK